MAGEVWGRRLSMLISVRIPRGARPVKPSDREVLSVRPVLRDCLFPEEKNCLFPMCVHTEDSCQMFFRGKKLRRATTLRGLSRRCLSRVPVVFVFPYVDGGGVGLIRDGALCIGSAGSYAVHRRS